MCAPWLSQGMGTSIRETSIKKAITIFAMGLCLCVAGTSWADVTLRIAWQLNAPMTQLQTLVKEGNALQNKINPGVRHELWSSTVEGDNVNSASLIVYFDDLEHYAQAVAREDSSDEWGEFNSRFPADKFPMTYVGLSRTLVGEEQDTAEGGEALSIIGFRLNGGAEELAAFVRQATEIQSSVNPKASIRLSAGLVAGSNVGSAAVLIRYPTMVDWAQGNAKLQASEAWGKFFATFPTDDYPIAFQGLATAIDID